MQVVAQRKPESALPMIKRYVSGGSEAEQRAAFEALGRLQGPQASASLVGALDQLAAGKVQPGAQAELLDAVSSNTAPAVKARWEKQQATWAGGKDELAPYRFALAGGNPWRGFDQFQNNPVLPCARCHRVYGEGGEAGPDLSRTGADHTPEYLLAAVVKPSAHIASGFDLVTFTLASGETESGSVVSESATQVVLKRGDGSQVTLDPKQVKQRVAAPSSMPEIYGQVLTRAQLRDVMAFLVRLDGKRGARQDEQAFGTSNRAMQSAAKEGAAGGHP
jgi:putative heme-binding domain-containing protein